MSTSQPRRAKTTAASTAGSFAPKHQSTPEVSLGEPAPSHADRVLEQNVNDLADYIAQHGHFPSNGRLYHFTIRLRNGLTGTSRNATVLTPERIAMLDQRVPGWSVKRGWEQGFREKAQKLADWVRENRGLPQQTRDGYPTGETEYRLHVYLTALRVGLTGRGGIKITPERAAFLDANVPGWRAGARQKWFDRVDRLAAWVARNNRLPAPGSGNSHEAALWEFLSNQRVLATSLKPERVEYLDERVPQWNQPRP